VQREAVHRRHGIFAGLLVLQDPVSAQQHCMPQRARDDGKQRMNRLSGSGVMLPGGTGVTASGSETVPRIEILGISKTFKLGAATIEAVRNVSFSVKRGEFVALLGPSGSGKSTVLNMIAALIGPDTGSVKIDGVPVIPGKATPNTGYVFQRDTLFPWRTANENIGYGLELKKVPPKERSARVADAIAQAGLQGFEHAYPSALSGGMRQRVSLMRTLIVKPQVLLMDEPFGALDTHTKIGMHGVLLNIWEREKQTVLFVTHDLGEALTLADRIILFSARPGQIKDVFYADLKRPRDAVAVRETPRYAALFQRIWHSLGEEFKKGQSL
jgi:NitT/TauT family transport system ATP-binding protein